MSRSKTLWFSFALVVLGALLDNLPLLQAYIDPKYYGVGYIIIGIIVAILRFVTTQPLEDK